MCWCLSLSRTWPARDERTLTIGVNPVASGELNEIIETIALDLPGPCEDGHCWWMIHNISIYIIWCQWHTQHKQLRVLIVIVGDTIELPWFANQWLLLHLLISQQMWVATGRLCLPACLVHPALAYAFCSCRLPDCGRQFLKLGSHLCCVQAP